MIFYFGSWEWRFGHLNYMISSMCDCPDVLHRLEYMVSRTELETLRIDPFEMIKAKIDYKYDKIHRVSLFL